MIAGRGRPSLDCDRTVAVQPRPRGRPPWAVGEDLTRRAWGPERLQESGFQRLEHAVPRHGWARLAGNFPERGLMRMTGVPSTC